MGRSDPAHLFRLSSFLPESRNLEGFSQKGFSMRHSTRLDMRDRRIPARALFPPLPSQSEIWQAESAAFLTKTARLNAPASRCVACRRLALPALPFAELLMPFGMLTLSLLN